MANLRQQLIHDDVSLVQWSEEKLSLCCIARDLLGQHIEQLDKDLQGLESELDVFSSNLDSPSTPKFLLKRSVETACQRSSVLSCCGLLCLHFRWKFDAITTLMELTRTFLHYLRTTFAMKVASTPEYWFGFVTCRRMEYIRWDHCYFAFMGTSSLRLNEHEEVAGRAVPQKSALGGQKQWVGHHHSFCCRVSLSIWRMIMIPWSQLNKNDKKGN